LIDAGPVGLPRHLGVGQLTQYPGRVPGDHVTCRHLHLGSHEGACTHEREVADDGTVHHHAVHAHQDAATDVAAVQHGAVADVPICFDHHIAAGKAVQHTTVLHVGTATHHDLAEVATQAGQRSNVRPGTNHHVTDENRFGVDECGGMHHRDDALDLVDTHPVNLRELPTGSTGPPAPSAQGDIRLARWEPQRCIRTGRRFNPLFRFDRTLTGSPASSMSGKVARSSSKNTRPSSRAR
jgi:hypothetical protein